MQSEKEIKIDRIYPGSQAERLGLLPEDLLVSINSHKLRDPIDFMFYSSEDSFRIEIRRDGKKFILNAEREEGRKFGVNFKPFKVMICKNNCIFCFVKQLPKGLRKTLYIKDDDYRMSFLYGNYIALSNLNKEDKKRIIEQRLSPLYISVHSTNRSLRNRLLGNAKGPDILKELKFLTDNKIRIHTQIVLCPGYNDGGELRKTITDLSRFYPYISSIAVVPVGFTRYRKITLKPVGKEEARNALKMIESFQKRFQKKHGDPIVYGADELYIKAELPFPPLRDYRDFPQIENGIGMVQLFMSQVKRLRLSRSLPRKKRFLTFTGTSFYPFLNRFTDKLREKEDLIVDILPVENRFFGTSVTVAGLLTGKDVIRTLLDKIENQEMLLVPDVVLKDRDDMFLDDITLKDMEEALGIPVRKIESTPEGLIQGIAGERR
jgi:putative radical SAM enzyme (TIGR03279 family)